MNFNDLLKLEGIEPKTVALALHNPGSQLERRRLCAMAAEDHDAFTAYQSTHPSIQEATLRKRQFMASFVPKDEGTFSFVGLYERELGALCTLAAIQNDAAFQRVLASLDRVKSEAKLAQIVSGRMRFSLKGLDALSDLLGRLVVRTTSARNYMRLAETTHLEVDSILSQPRITPPMPSWDEVQMLSEEIRELPLEWAAHLAAWRGIYLIVDQTDGARYVGAAYGHENLLGRWRTHTVGDVGVTKELSKRNPSGFRFSILELLAPSAEIGEVTRKERTWMDRLHTIQYGLNT